MHQPPHMPQLAHDLPARVVDRARHLPPALDLLLAPDARRGRPAEPFARDPRRFADDEPGAGALAVIGRHHRVGDRAGLVGPSARQRRHQDAIVRLYGAETDRIEENVMHRAPLPQAWCVAQGARKARRMEAHAPRRGMRLAALLAGNAALALGPWFVRLADSGPVAAGFWRLALAVPFLTLLARTRGQPLRPGGGAMLIGAVCLAGVIFAADLASWHIGIERTRLANATLFGNSGSLILMVWGFVALRRLPGGGEWAALACAFAGGAILLARSASLSGATLSGDLMCLLAGVFYAGYLVLAQGARGRMGSWAVLFWVSAAGAPVMLAMALLRGEPVWPGDWTPLVALFVSSQLVGQGLLVWSLAHFPAWIIGLALLTQPAVAALAGWLAFGERLTAIDAFGMVLVAAGLALARAIPVRPPPSS